MLYRTLLASALLFVMASVIHADPFGDNPFGFKMGMTQDDVRNLEGVVVDSALIWNKKPMLILSKVPVPDARFVSFDLYFTEKHGLYKFLARSDTIRIGTGGGNIMPKYVELRKDLTKAYGTYTRSAYVEGVNAWEDAANWLSIVGKRSGRHDGRAFISGWRPGYWKKSKQLRDVELSIYLTDPSNFLLMVDFHNAFDAQSGN